MATVSIAPKRSECIGCGLYIETAPEYWYMNDQSEAQLHDIRIVSHGLEHGKGDDYDRDALETAAAGCLLKHHPYRLSAPARTQKSKLKAFSIPRTLRNLGS